MKTMHQNSPVDRRTFLKGAGVSLALPFMDSLGWTAHAKTTAKPPVRLATLANHEWVIRSFVSTKLRAVDRLGALTALASWLADGCACDSETASCADH